MAEHKAVIHWKRGDGDFLKGRYSREHTWQFDGGLSVPASPSPHVVPAPWSNPANIDPEEAFVASVSSCHMLTFLYLASKRGFDIASYDDEAVGAMTKGPNGTPWINLITLNPRIIYTGEKRPNPSEEEELHHLAHEQCFIANSIKTEVRVSHVPSVESQPAA
jgi:organic hydroperoxide reductase OsmC/OhrA